MNDASLKVLDMVKDLPEGTIITIPGRGASGASPWFVAMTALTSFIIARPTRMMKRALALANSSATPLRITLMEQAKLFKSQT